MAAERKFVAENIRRVLLKEYLMKEVSRAGFGGLDVQRTPMGTSVVLATERPGLVIGRRGQTIKTLTSVIEQRFGFENPQIEVHEVENPNLNAQIMAEKLAYSLERGWHFRRAGHSSVRRIMESGAKGCHIIIAGKLTGQRKRTEKFKDGYIKFCGEPKIMFMSKGYAVAKMKQGIIGVTVEIMQADARLPADISIIEQKDVQTEVPEPVPVEDKRPKGRQEGQRSEQRPKRHEDRKPRDQNATADRRPKAETVTEDRPKKESDRKPKEPKAEPAAEAKVEVAVEEPEKATARKPKEPKAEPAAEAKVEVAVEEKPKKAAAKEPKTEATVEEKPKKATARKPKEPKAEAVEVAEVAVEEKPKKTAARKPKEPKTESAAETAVEEKPKKAAAKKPKTEPETKEGQ